MGVLSAIGDILSNTPIGKLAERAVDRILPKKLTEEERALLAKEFQAIEHQQRLEMMQFALAQDAEFNARIKDLEGTASDLKSVPVVGPLVLFLRGCIRPTFAYGTLYFDYNWFVNMSAMTPEQEKTLFFINMLVLGFLFGERSIKNLSPLIKDFFASRGVKKADPSLTP